MAKTLQISGIVLIVMCMFGTAILFGINLRDAQISDERAKKLQYTLDSLKAESLKYQLKNLKYEDYE